MNSKQTLLLVLVAVVLGGAGIAVWKKDKSTYNSGKEKMGARLLGDFDVNAVGGLALRHESNSVTVARSGDAWVLKERGDYPANFDTIAELVRKLADLKVASPVKVGPSRLPMLELVGPDQKGPGTLIELKDAAGKPLKTLLLGKKHRREEAAGNASPFGGGSDNGRYVMVDGKIDSVAVVADALWNAEPRIPDWLNKDFVKVEGGVRSLSVTQPNSANSWTVTRTNADSPDWKLAGAAPSETLDANQSAGWAAVLANPSFNDVLVVKPGETAITNPVVATVTTFSGFTYKFTIGRKDDNDVLVQVAVSGEFPRERVAAPDEKPEDKAKFDKEFADKTQKLQDKLKSEQAFAKWTYLGAKWSFDPVLKERREILSTNAPAATPPTVLPGPGAGASLGIPPEMVIPPLAPNPAIPAAPSTPPPAVKPPSPVAPVTPTTTPPAPKPGPAKAVPPPPAPETKPAGAPEKK